MNYIIRERPQKQCIAVVWWHRMGVYDIHAHAARQLRPAIVRKATFSDEDTTRLATPVRSGHNRCYMPTILIGELSTFAGRHPMRTRSGLGRCPASLVRWLAVHPASCPRPSPALKASPSHMQAPTPRLIAGLYKAVYGQGPGHHRSAAVPPAILNIGRAPRSLPLRALDFCFLEDAESPWLPIPVEWFQSSSDIRRQALNWKVWPVGTLWALADPPLAFIRGQPHRAPLCGHLF